MNAGSARNTGMRNTVCMYGRVKQPSINSRLIRSFQFATIWAYTPSRMRRSVRSPFCKAMDSDDLRTYPREKRKSASRFCCARFNFRNGVPSTCVNMLASRTYSGAAQTMYLGISTLAPNKRMESAKVDRLHKTEKYETTATSSLTRPNPCVMKSCANRRQSSAMRWSGLSTPWPPSLNFQWVWFRSQRDNTSSVRAVRHLICNTCCKHLPIR